MDIEQYLKQLENELKGLSPKEKGLILEEINNHHAEGIEDIHLSKDATNSQKLMDGEMGNPRELGRRLYNIHHPKRWLEYLLIVFPDTFIFPIFIILMDNYTRRFFSQDLDFMVKFLIIPLDYRVPILFNLCAVGVCFLVYRRQGLFTGLLYWLSLCWVNIFVLCIQEEAWSFYPQAEVTPFWLLERIFWCVALIVIFIVLTKILLKKRDILWVVLALTPFLMAIAQVSVINLQYLVIRDVIPGWGFVDGFYLPYYLAKVIWPALLIFPRQRFWRWLGLMIFIAPLVMLNLRLYSSLNSPYLIILWALPAVLVFGCWIFDLINTRRLLFLR